MPDNQNKDNNPRQSDKNQNQASRQSESQGTAAQRQQSPGGTDFTKPNTELGDENPSKGQEGQPGLNDPDKGEWSPTSRHSER